MDKTYGDGFYALQESGSLASAREIIPIILRYLTGEVNSVIDLGCGRGAWLSVFLEHGIGEITGVDGDYVNKDKLLIEASCFIAHDLTLPFVMMKKFDLAMSVEVAEHIPTENAGTFVRSLCKHSDVVLFSAAIPGQTGKNHVNEQWPSYWAELFKQEGYLCCDIIRPQIWRNKKIDTFYRQNIMLYVSEASPGINFNVNGAAVSPLDAIHPDLFEDHLLPLIQMQKKIIRKIVPRVCIAIKKRIKKR